jgi:hypothetical protein
MSAGLAFRHGHGTASPSKTKRLTSPTTALRAWWSQARLDRDLAAGADPAADSRLSVRARGLASARMRRRIAGSFRSVIEDAESTRKGMSSEAPAQDRIVREAEPALRTLADALLADGFVEPRGVALALMLLTDTAGPLYRAESPRALTKAALTAATALRDGRRA